MSEAHQGEAHDDKPGPIGDRVLYEDSQVRIWEMVLEPGERSPRHHHDNDYVVVIVEGDHATVEPVDEVTGEPGPAFSAAMEPGKCVSLRKGATEVAINSGTRRYRDIQIELLN